MHNADLIAGPLGSGMTDASLAPIMSLAANNEIMIRLADEGVPVRAIARVTRRAADYIREVLREALEAGAIVQVPRDDWPSTSTRDSRIPELKSIVALDEELILLHMVRLFKVTKLQGSLLLALIRRREVTRASMHQIVEQRRANRIDVDDETDVKIVDVVICNLRKRLKPFNILIETVWSCGYHLSPEHRSRAATMLLTFINDPENC